MLYTLHNIRNDKAFYGFIWAIAGNVYKQWYKKKLRVDVCELDENFYNDNVDFEMILDSNNDIYLLRHELSLLSEKYRKATILYYLENKSCAEISKCLSITESMVKYLLFKSRKILKEGMNMERNYGEQSYNPKKFSLLFWGDGANRYYNLCDKKIPQNILLACYNDALTDEQISLMIGVALPYIEDELKTLLEYNLLMKNGNKYSTNIVIFTQEFTREVDMKTASLHHQLADIINKTICDKETEIRKIGFVGANMSKNTFMWQITCILLHQAIIEKLQKNINVDFPVDKFGTPCFIWGSEGFSDNLWDGKFGFGICKVTNDVGDYMQFMDFPINGEMVHHYFNLKNICNIYFDIANGFTDKFSENDLECVADMVKLGYIKNENGKLTVNVPIFTKSQYVSLIGVLDEIADSIAQKSVDILGIVSQILQNHTPTHLKSTAKKMAYLRLFEDAISAPIRMLYNDGILKQVDASDFLPTTYIVLNK